MKSQLINKHIYSAVFLLVLSNSVAAAPAVIMAPPIVPVPGKFYVGFFGGGGASTNFDVTQFGTALFREAIGGPLAVNALGSANVNSTWLVGAQVGYQAPAILLDSRSQWAIAPATELEGYYLGKNTLTSHLVNDEPARLPEHDFRITLPMKTGVFLANAVVNLNIPCVAFHPYAGIGIGGAVVNISGADSKQIAPPELGVNHFSANTSDTSPTFAGQIKVGLGYDINNYVGLFAEYRWLYLSSSHFQFGSTIAPGHAVTTNWPVKLDTQYYNMGSVGIRFSA